MSAKKVVLVLSVLLFPSLIYVLFSSGKHHIDKPPYLGPWVNETPYTIPEFSLINYTGDTITSSQLQNNILVFNFFCLTCSDSSARNALLVKAVTERFFDKKDIKYISINLTPSQFDSSAVAEYIRPFNISPEDWFFVNGDSADLADFAHQGLLVNSEFDSIGVPFKPGMATIVVVDKERHVRGILDGNQYVEQSSIIDVIKLIRLEEYQKNSVRRDDQFERKRGK
jgi:protein SCO1/2